MNNKIIQPLRPTSSLVVELQAGGVQLSTRAAAPPVVVTFSGLLLISALQAGDIVDADAIAAQVASEAGTEHDAVMQFLNSLIRRGRLRRRANAIPVAPAKPSRAVSVCKTWPDQCLLALKLPLNLRMCEGKFELIDHDGHLIVALDAAELVAVGQFVSPVDFATGFEGQAVTLKSHAVETSRMHEILSRLENARLLSRVERVAKTKAVAPESLSRAQAHKINFARQHAQQNEEEASRQRQSGVCRPQVIPVWFDEGIPAGLGLIFSYAKAYEGGKLDRFYDFRLSWVWDDERLASYTAKPAIYLCSNYLWSHEKSIAVSEAVKRLSPDSITIHGGPDTPKYEDDAQAYFRDHPHVDIVIRGEGEASAAETLDRLSRVIGDENPDLSVLAEVQGISYRYRGEIFRNPDRPRILDLDTIPSPYTTGLFDAYIGVPRLHATLETNRGCPYGCTFCDWGSATTSKIRKFDLQRVFDELKWCSDAKVQSVSQADANFGVFERDVAIAEWVAELKQSTGYPVTFGGSYAKNSTKYLQKIIKVLADAGILAQGVLSLQTMDDGTLSAIKRSNIKVEKYDALANEMRESNLQLTIELMMGLPGATLESFMGDLQQCIDRDVPARINHTTMLVNSPMNNPDYRNEHQIETGTALGPGKMPVLVSTKTYTRDDLKAMLEIRQMYMLMDNFGVLRLCSRFVRQQTGTPEIEFYHQLLSGMDRHVKQVKWPLLSTLAIFGQHIMAPVFSWALVIDELRLFLIEECGVPDDTALDAILKAQHALLPAHGRTYPCTVALEHDVSAWHSQMLETKKQGHLRDWQLRMPPLSDFGPGKMQVIDEGGWVTSMLGCDIELSASGVNWDMSSDIGRARVDQDFNSAWEEEEIVQVS